MLISTDSNGVKNLTLLTSTLPRERSLRCWNLNEMVSVYLGKATAKRERPGSAKMPKKVSKSAIVVTNR